MTMFKEIENKAMQLTSMERGHLVHDLILSFDRADNYPDDYEKEIQRRITNIKSGTAKGTPANQVFSFIENKHV
ncbi:MAG: addiction module protein [Victivallaceae bacterium]|nr:addiction module protein [Victivallaceae bacterium]